MKDITTACIHFEGNLKEMNIEDELKTYKNECKKYIPSNEFNSSVFLGKINDLRKRYESKWSNDQQNGSRYNRLFYDATIEIFQDTCVKYRYDHDRNIERVCGSPVNEVKIIMAQNNYLLDTVEELKKEISALKSEKAEETTVLYLQNEHLTESISELKKEVSTLRSMLSYNGNIETFVKVIQRYWRRYLLIKNVKKFAHEYELAMLRDFRKSIVNRESLLHAAESRVKQPVKMSPSNPKNWSDYKAASIASDWNS